VALSPPRQLSAYNIFRKFQRDGVWEAIWAEPHMALRERMGREASPSAAVLDSQSVKLAEKGGGKDDQVGYMDFEKPAETLATFVTLASIQLAIGRLARA